MKDDHSASRRNTIASPDGPMKKSDNSRGMLQDRHGVQANGTQSQAQPVGIASGEHVGLGNVFVLPFENGHSAPHRTCSETVSSTLDEVMPRMKSFMSDPIGREQDLGSGGPLDDGIGLCLTSCNGQDLSQQNLEILTDSHASIVLNRSPSRVNQPWRVEGKDRSSSSTDESPSGNGASAAVHARFEPYHGNLATPSPIRYHPANISHNEFAHEQADRSGHDQTSNHATYAAPVPSVPTTTYNRRSGRSRTSQGIPAHKLRLLLGESASILEEAPFDRSDGSENDCEETDRLMEELQMYKERSVQLEEQIKVLHALLEDKVRDQLALASSMRSDRNGESKGERLWESTAAHLGAFLGAYSPGANSFAGSVPSMTMSPDPFSPFHAAGASPQIHTPKDCLQGAETNLLREPYRNNDIALNLSTNKGTSDGQVGLSSPNPVPIVEAPYLTGLRVNLNPNDVQTHDGITPHHGQEAIAPSLGEQNSALRGASASKVPLETPLQSPFYAQMTFPHPVTAMHPSMLPSSLVTPPFRSASGSSTCEERTGRLPGADNHVPPEALVSRALSAKNQEASIVLQQQLKTASATRKAAIIRALAPHILKLADDKHGNFLVQRAIGVDPQLAWRLQRRFVSLSLSQFGCHVVQKLLDEHEDLCKTIVTELLADRVMETLTCKNSIHIWQKVFELRWSDNGDMRSKIFGTVNATLRGRWADTAMLETGSIICQNIFESAGEMEKGECLSEILHRLAECASNQWGVWVVQHIIEHSGAETRKIAFQQLLGSAAALTLSQYGQKAIMSALKSRDPEFVASYIDILCDRDASMANVSGPSSTQSSNGGSVRRSVLVDVSTAPQGVQIVTQLLTSVTPEQRERIIKTVRKNSVFLKGSKAGLRVHQLCERARAFTGY